MPHGGPDWGTLGPLDTVYTIEDMGELAARLGSIVTFDRRGNVLFLEGFSGSLAKVCPAYYYGEPGEVSISSEKALHGDFSCKLVTTTTALNKQGVKAALSYPVLGKMGSEFCWRISTDVSHVMVRLRLNNGTTWYYGELSWRAATKTWSYATPSGDVALSPLVDYSTEIFNHTKLVVDFSNGKYCHFISNDHDYDLTDQLLWQAAEVYPPQIGVQFAVTNGSGGNQAVGYLDSIIVTQNEP